MRKRADIGEYSTRETGCEPYLCAKNAAVDGLDEKALGLRLQP
jgi:hypothetical protein